MDDRAVALDTVEAEGAASAKGLRSGSLGLLSSVVIGIGAVCPAYALALTAGLLSAAVGVKAPFVLIISFVPMLLVASGYYYMNRADPDCGETFVWTWRAFGPRVGWVVGFAGVFAIIFVLPSVLQIASMYMWLFLGLPDLAESTTWVIVGGLAWLVAVGAVVALGIKISARVQNALMVVQLGTLLVFLVWTFIKAVVVQPEGYTPISLSWFFTTDIGGKELAAGVVLAVFLYWGWDVVLAVNEESEDSRRVPGVSALLTTVALVVLYVLSLTAMQTYHGAGFLADNYEDVFAPLAADVMGSGWDRIVFLSVFTSAVVGFLTSLLPITRQLLSMAAHKALPQVFGRIHPRFMTPLWGTVIVLVVVAALYAVITAYDPALFWDAVSASGIICCLAYGGTGLAATIYYRKELLKSRSNFFLMGVCPSLGAALFAVILVKVVIDDWDPANSLASVFGIGGIFVMGVGTVVLSAVLMLLMNAVRPGFFRRKPETWPGEGQPLPYADERVV